jgi:hypothetical protein
MIFSKVRKYLRVMRMLQRANIAMTRGHATRSQRALDPHNPLTWEFSGFSQHGEDGIIDVLTGKIARPNFSFVEIGASFGTENNTTWLAAVRKYRGLMVEGNPNARASLSLFFSEGLEIDVDTLELMVTPENAAQVISRSLYPDPDVFSMDIDGNDYYVLKSILEGGMKPKIIVVEYNSAFGPENSLTIEYQPDLGFLQAEETRLYYGVSIKGWKKFLGSHAYRFVTVDSSGVNAFFVNPAALRSKDISRIKGLPFRENMAQLARHRGGWKEQFELIREKPLVSI